TMRRRHARHFLGLAEAADARLVGPQQGVWLDRLEQEDDNLRTALDWAIRVGEVELGLRLASALWRFWDVRGHAAEGRERLARLLAVSEGVKPQVRQKAYFVAGVLADGRGDYPTARHYFEANLALSRQLGDSANMRTSLFALGNVAYMQGDYQAARALYEEQRRQFDESHTP